MKKKSVCAMLCAIIPFTLSAQEALKSTEESYYDFLALQGLSGRPYLNYRTFSDSRWAVNEGASHPWERQNLGIRHQVFDHVFLRIYGPELYSSFNTAAPYGQNDGALWQGKGLNAALSGGIRAEGYGVELTFRPQLSFSQNLEFDLLPSAYESKYGYYWALGYNTGVDAPQRFGDKPFFTFDWGDTEIRYTWRNLTIGFGTQAVWLGPSQINAIIHSNNAPAYPKIDLGLRRQRITIPWLDWYLGDLELRVWAGQLRESAFFDSDDRNNNHLISGLAVAFAPSILPGLSFFANRTYTAEWAPESADSIVELFRVFRSAGGSDDWDQHVSAGFEYLFPQVGFDVYAEIAYNDTPGRNIPVILKNFSHTMAFTAGFKKALTVSAEKNIRGELMFEYTHLEMTPFASQFYWANTFYFHHQITQGYTNGGQWLGAGIGTGGNSQYLGYKLYYLKGFTNIFLYRFNSDNDYLVRETTPAQGYAPFNAVADQGGKRREKTVLTFGVGTGYFLTDNVSLSGELAYSAMMHFLYTDPNLHNLRFSFRVETRF